MAEYFILSLKWTKKAEPYITFWGPNNGGYRWALSECGRYSEAQVRAEASYYNNGDSTLAVPCDAVERMATEGSASHMDRRADMRVIRNSPVNMKHLKGMAYRLPSAPTTLAAE